MSNDGSKTEEPTQKRLQDAMDKGQVARTPDINVVFILAAGFATLLFTVKEQATHIFELTESVLGHLGRTPITVDSISEWIGLAVGTMIRLVAPMAAACAIAGAIGSGLQSKFHFSSKALELKFERINPIQGFKRLFSKQSWVKLGTDGLKLIVVGVVVWQGVKGILGDPLFYTPVSMARLGLFMQETAAMLITRFILAFGIIAAINYLYQFRKTGEDLKMTKQEVKDEYKNSEGDPHTKARLRGMARRLLQRQMLREVEHADVVLTNPTHYAVALRYDRGKDSAPVVLAKGERYFALRIKAVAKKFDVPMVENKPVARMLFKYGKVGQAIPYEMYKAVAEILAFVYKTNRYYFHNLKHRRAEAARRSKLTPAKR